MTTLRQSYRTSLFSQMPETSVFCEFPALFGVCGDSRVKRCSANEMHGNAPFPIERLPERGVNTGAFDMQVTAILPQGDL